jgi:hypothetical protein
MMAHSCDHSYTGDKSRRITVQARPYPKTITAKKTAEE